MYEVLYTLKKILLLAASWRIGLLASVRLPLLAGRVGHCQRFTLQAVIVDRLDRRDRRDRLEHQGNPRTAAISG